MAFLKNSRYADQPTVTATLPNGREVTAITLRIAPKPEGNPYVVKENERLDQLTDRVYQDPTRFWRVADANSECDARRLEETGKTLTLPSSS